jgi:hypothetical protein
LFVLKPRPWVELVGKWWHIRHPSSR